LPLANNYLYIYAWLAGFIDSDGSFSINSSVNDLGKRRVSCSFRLDQRLVDPVTGESYEPILAQIASFLACNLNTTGVKASGNSYYHIHAKSVKSINIFSMNI
jgi:hypothetical protein